MIDDERFVLLEKEAAAVLEKSKMQQAQLNEEWEAINKLTTDELALRQEIATIAQSVIDGTMSVQEAGERLEAFVKDANGHDRPVL